MSVSNLNKIFVGNVPFYCDATDFQDFFKKYDGCIKAEIIYKPNTKISRGFGFIIFDSPENALKLLGRTDVVFNDRNLRFTTYAFSNKKHSDNICPAPLGQKNYLLVKTVRPSMTREDLKSLFANIAPIGKHFVTTSIEIGEKGCGIVEILDNVIFNYLLKKQILIDDNANLYELSRWIMQKNYVRTINKEKMVKKNILSH
jgi:RNA recognition motif-containing protein